MKSSSETLPCGLFRWEVTARRPEHFRAVRRLSLQSAGADARALAVFGLLLYMGFSALALAAGGDLAAKMRRWGGGGHLGQEALLQAALVLAWAGLTYALRPRRQVWEAQPGWLRFGRRMWQSEALRGLRFYRRRWHDPGIGPNPWFVDPAQTGTLLEIAVVLADGREQTAWRHACRFQKRARAWAEAMARVAGVPVLGSRDAAR